MRHFAPHTPVSQTARAEPLTSAYDLFLAGYDTNQIARLQWRTEASVLHEINVAEQATPSLFALFALRGTGMTWLATHLISIAVGIIIGRAAARRQIAKRKAKADELRWMLAPTIPHSIEDVIRRSGV